MVASVKIFSNQIKQMELDYHHLQHRFLKENDTFEKIRLSRLLRDTFIDIKNAKRWLNTL